MTRLFSSMVVFFSMTLSIALCGCKDPCEVYDSFDVPRGASLFEYIRESNQKEAACVDYANNMDTETRMTYLCNHDFKGNASKFKRFGCAELRRMELYKSGKHWAYQCKTSESERANTMLDDKFMLKGFRAENSLDDDGNPVVVVSFGYEYTNSDELDSSRVYKYPLVRYNESKQRFVKVACDKTVVYVEGKEFEYAIPDLREGQQAVISCTFSGMDDSFDPKEFGIGDVYFSKGKPLFAGSDYDWKCEAI